MNNPTIESDDSIALFQYSGDIGYNDMLYDFNNIKVFEVFHDFTKSELTKKVFAIPELPFIRIQENKLGLIEYFSEISEFTTKLVDTDIQILIDISTGGISTSYYPDLLSLIKMHKLKYGNVTVLVNTKFEYETLVNLTKLENTPITVI